MSISWTCKYGFYHDREVVFDEPASGNGYIYSAYAKEIGLPVDLMKIQETAENCLTDEDYWFIRRRPDMKTPPFSPDELLGLVALDIPMSAIIYRIANNGWTWLNHVEIYDSYSIWETIRDFWEARNKHRNFLWKEERLSTFKYMFKVPPSHRYFFKVKCGISEPTLWETFMWNTYKYWTNWRGSASEKNILWLQCSQIKDPFLVRVDVLNNFKRYFPVGHIFIQRLLGVDDGA